MKKILILSSILLTLGSAASFAQSTYGKAFNTTNNTYSAARTPGLMVDKTKMENITLSGKTKEVCQKEGCWLVMTPGDGSSLEVMVKMKDHAFKVPKDLAGKNIVANGTLIKKTQSVEEQKHYLEDAGASAEEIAKIVSPKSVYELQAVGVAVVN